MGIPLGQWSGSDATERLRETVEKNSTETSRQNRWLLWMTGAILLLTVVVTVLTAMMWFQSRKG